MKISESGLNLIQRFEGYEDKAYQDSAGIWTIGWGTIRYPNGKPIQENDTCNVLAAENWLINDLIDSVKVINDLGLNLTQNQFDAVCSFIYNVGKGAFKSSTLLKKIQADPNDPTITDAFMMFDKAKINGVLTEVAGLKTRRQAESDYYFH